MLRFVCLSVTPGPAMQQGKYSCIMDSVMTTQSVSISSVQTETLWPNNRCNRPRGTHGLLHAGCSGAQVSHV